MSVWWKEKEGEYFAKKAKQGIDHITANDLITGGAEPTGRQAYIDNCVREAVLYLLSLSACPECGKDMAHDVIGSKCDSLGEVDFIRCPCPYHPMQYCEQNPDLVVWEFPNLNWDREWAKKVKRDTLTFWHRNRTVIENFLEMTKKELAFENASGVDSPRAMSVETGRKFR